MSALASYRSRVGLFCELFLFAALLTPAATAAPTFVSLDPRLPNPDQPYVLTSGPTGYGGIGSSLYALSIRVSDLSQLSIPMLRTDGSVDFDSSFDVEFEAIVSLSLEPPHPVSGVGTARVTGFAPSVGGSALEPVVVYDAELVELNLTSLFGAPEVHFRESPELDSTGELRVEGGCYGVCPAEGTSPEVLLPMRISSFLDVYTEVSHDGGSTWFPTVDNPTIHLEQAPEPASVTLGVLGGACLWTRARRRGGARR